MKYLSIAALMVTLFSGCGGNVNYDKAATQTGVEQETLKRLCKEITCDYDDLKDRLEVTASDGSAFTQAMTGNENRKIEFSWIGGTDQIRVRVFDTFLYGSWHFDEQAEIYIGKDLILTVSDSVDRVIGQYNEIASEHEQTEIVSGYTDFKTARTIAEADRKKVTIRFYGKNGYKDIKYLAKHHLIDLVKLAEIVR